MNCLIFRIHYGSESKEAMISKPEGMSGDISYQVHINNYFQGTVKKQGGEWKAHLNQKSQLTIDDIQIIGDIIEVNVR